MGTKTRKVRMGGAMRGRLASHVRCARRETLYKMIAKKNGARVPCFVCGLHVTLPDATLEHILPLSAGGTDEMENLSISHGDCNRNRATD